MYGLATIVGRMLSYLLQPYYAHQFLPAQNGIQSVVYSFIPIISIALYLGMDVAYMRNAASVKDAPFVERQRVFSMSMSVVAAIGGALTALALVASPWLAPFTRLDVTSFRYMMAIVFTDALLTVPYAHLRMTNRALRFAALRLLFVGISIALNFFLIGYLHWGVSAIFFSNLAANLAVLALFLGEISRLFRPGLLSGAPWRPLWAYALPVIPATLAVMVVENGDRITLNYLPERAAQLVYRMTSSDAVVGVYSFNYKLGVAMLLVVQMFRLAWVPFSLQHAREERAPELYSRVLTALMLVCALVFLGVSLLLPAVAQVPAVHDYVKPDYWLGLSIVPVILLGYVFSGMYAVVTAGLYIERKTNVLAWIAGAGRAAQHRHLHRRRAAVGDGQRCVGHARGVCAHGEPWGVAGQPRLSGAVRVAPPRVPLRPCRRAVRDGPGDGVTGRRAPLRRRPRLEGRAAARVTRAARGYRVLPARRDARATLDAVAALVLDARLSDGTLRVPKRYTVYPL